MPRAYLQLLLALAGLAAEVGFQVPVAPPRTHGHLLALAEGQMMRGVNEVQLLQACTSAPGLVMTAAQWLALRSRWPACVQDGMRHTYEDA